MKCYYFFSLFLLVMCSADILISHEKEDEKLESRIRLLLTATEFKGARKEILNHGDLVLPILEEILSTPPDGAIDELRISRALIVLGQIGGNASNLRPLVRRNLLSASAMIHGQAAEALVSIGSKEDVPALVAMLYDPRPDVRRLAALLIGKLGDESALPALRLWRKQAAQRDKHRSPEEEWLTEKMLEIVHHAEAAIKRRNDDTAGAETDSK